jgi:putative ABC transport system permease protein
VLSVALATLRARWVSFAGAFLTLALGSGFVAIMLMTLTATSGIPFPGPQRFAAAPIVVVPHKTERFTADGFPFSLPVQQPGGLPAPVVKRLASMGRTVPDHTFPAQQAGGPPGQVGHAWSAASFTPYRLVAGHPPATASEVVVGGGSPALVGHRVQVTTAEGTSTYTVAGVTRPVWFEHAIFFTDAAAAHISPPIDAVVAYGPPGAVRRAAGRGATQVLTGAARKQADPDPSGGQDQLYATSAAAGTSTGLGVFVAVFVMIATFAFITDQRRRELGLLRAIGATPRQVRRMIITEAAVVGVVASAAGCALGPLGSSLAGKWLIGHGVAPAWFTVHVTGPPLIIAFAIGLASAIVGATAASWRAAQTRPTEALRDAVVEQKVMTVTRWLLGVGLLALGAYVSLTTITRNPGNAMIVKNYLAVFVPIVAGFTLLTPVILKPVARLVTWPVGRMGAGSMIVRQSVLTGGRRTAATAAPIVLALGLAASMLTLEAIANATSYSAMRRQANAEFVIVPTESTELSRQTVTAIRRIPAADVTEFTSILINVAADSGAYIDTWTAQAVEPATLNTTQNFTPVAGSLSHLGSDFLIIDQRTAQADGLHAAEPVKAYLPDGTSIRLRIAAVIHTVTTEATVFIPAADAADGLPTQMDVTARPGADVAAVGAALRAAVRGHRAIVTPIRQYLEAVRSQQTQQDRQATTVILGLALIYALIAVANTLVMAASGRRREIAALSLAGATRRQALRFIAAESALVVVIGAILAAGAATVVVVGQWVALTRFSTDAPVSIPWLPIGAITAGCAAVAVLASVLPAWPVLRARVVELADLRE